ncbi:TIGR02530 family flagellar biosynthesis protein [Anoxynatronum buryatiense]|uniref:Flagellar operon protein n=1 Tax=Anoxynatronum buryatiense TaxID=489973 RepID=A0AA45WUC4_9CLOT|nr:TIGR02530 family flagellar biosynthesis protein [Anoxynatronum buryatiense]SMP47259.1 flagellar operon protein [Anoxynatronum buryatiense]
MKAYELKINSAISPVQPAAGNPKITSATDDGNSFKHVLNEHVQRQHHVVFSKHATERLMQRNIILTPQEILRIDAGISQAAKKGIKETLIMMDNRAFIASVKNKTVITATVEDQLKDQVFTNIDGAVIV